MDLLGISDSILWDTLRSDASLLDGIPKDAVLIVSAPADIHILGMLGSPLSGGMAVVSYRVADETEVYCYVLLTHEDTSVAKVLMAFRAAEIVAHMDPGCGFSSLALCVDMGGYLAYLVIGPLPSQVMHVCSFHMVCATTATATHSPSISSLLGPRTSIRLQPPHDLLATNVNTEITPQTMRDTLLRALPAQHSCLLALPPSCTLSKELLRSSHWPGVLEALFPPSLGGAVHMITGPCRLHAAAWMGVASAMESDHRPAKKHGFVAVLREALLVLLVEGVGVEVPCCVVPWDEFYGYQEPDVLESSCELHVALVESIPLFSSNFTFVAQDLLEPNYAWLSIMLPTSQERNALVDAVHRAYYNIMGREIYAIKASEFSDTGLSFSQPYCSMIAVQDRQTPMSCTLYRRKPQDLPHLLPSTPTISMLQQTPITLPLLDNAEGISVKSFAQLLLYHTSIVLLLFDCVMCPPDEDVADLFITAFAEFSPQPDSNIIGAPLVLSALRVECFLRRLPTNLRGPLRCAAGRDCSAACEEIVVRFFAQHIAVLWDAAQAHIPSDATCFGEDILPCLTRALRALPSIPAAITLVYDALLFSCGMEADEGLCFVAQRLLAALRRVARAALGPALRCGPITTTATTEFASVCDCLRSCLVGSPRGDLSEWSEWSPIDENDGAVEAAGPALRRMAGLWSARAAQTLSALVLLGCTHALSATGRTLQKCPVTAEAQQLCAALTVAQETVRCGETVVPVIPPQKLSLHQSGSVETRMDAAVQTVRTSAQEEEQMRVHLRLHTRLRFLEESIQQQKEEEQQRRAQQKESKEKEKENFPSAGVPFAYLQAYRAHLVRAEALERQVDELKRHCAEQREELLTVQREKDALVTAAAEAVAGPSLSKAMEMFGAELRRFAIAREEHERDKITFIEAKKRTTLLCMMLHVA